MSLVSAAGGVRTRVAQRLRKAATSALGNGTSRTTLLALAELSRRIGGSVPGEGAQIGLAPFELRVFSQNGEDGVIAEILRRTGTDLRYFVEFGAASAEANCLFLADVCGWRGLFMDGDAEATSSLARKYSANGGVAVRRAIVTPANIEMLFANACVPGEPDVVSIDIDGLDYYVWEALKSYRPRLVVIEYNGGIDVTRRLVQPHDVEAWDGTTSYGASLAALESLARDKGYRLVYTELTGNNAFFVRDDLSSAFVRDQDVPRRASNFRLESGHHVHDTAGSAFIDLDAGMSPTPNEDDVDYLRERWEREQDFHDDLAAKLDPTTLPAVEPVHYDDVVLAAARVSAGTRVLDLGCGQGDLTLALLARGASVTGLDLSGGMLEVARRRVELYGNGRSATFVAAPVERTGLTSGTFDVIVGRWILHHIDLRPAASELARLLVPGGRAVFLENSGANPVLNFARDHVAGRFGIPRLGTKDERPLVPDDWRVLERSFTRVRGEFPIVDIFELLNRQVFRYRFRAVASACHSLDRVIARSRLRKYSYRVLVVAEK